MSTDASATEGPTPDAADCTLCAGEAARSPSVAVQCYGTDAALVPTHAERDEFLGCCPDCAAELDELVAAWDARDPPPVGRTDAIATDYALTAQGCGFCGDAVDDARNNDAHDRDAQNDDARPRATDSAVTVLGVEVYRPGADWRRNYVLCSDCAAVFEEFLATVANDAGDD